MDISKVKDADKMGKGMNRNGIRITSHKPVVHSRNAEGNKRPGAATRRTDKVTPGDMKNRHRAGGFKGTALVVLLTFTMVFASVLGAFADDLTNTVPSEEAPGGTFYSDTINTGLGTNGPNPSGATYKGYGPDYGPYEISGVYQSQSTASPTSFAAGLPLGTIFIDQSKISQTGGVTKVVATNPQLTAGLVPIEGTNKMGYDGTQPGAILMVPGKINELNGDLFKVTFEDAAILPNGDRAHLVITYSNARIVIDERYMALPDGSTYYEVKRCADEKNTNPAPTPMTRVTGDTYDNYPVYKGSNGLLYYLKSGKYYRIFEISPVESQPVNPSATTEKFTYNGKQYTVYTEGGKRYIKPDNERYYHGAVSLAQGNAISYGGTDYTDMSETYGDAAVAIVNETAGGFGETYTRQNKGTDPAKPNSNIYPTTGLTMDATYQIVNKDGTPAAGTFVFAVCGINLDRDPDAGTGTNTAKPLWYVGAEKFNDGTKEYQVFTEGSTGTKKYINKGTATNPNWYELASDGTVSPTPAVPQPSGTMVPVVSEAGKDHSFFSEAMEIAGGQKSEYVYVRPNTSQEDNPDKITGVKGQYFYPNVSLHNGNIKFIGNQVDANLSGVSGGLGGNDNSYNAGFVTLADAATGFKVTATGHGNSGAGMNSLVFNSKQIWYRYTSSTGRHGSIQTTSEGNYKGTLNDGGDILEPEGYFEDGSATHDKKATHVVAEGKDVYYTMTPDTGYKLKTLKIGKNFDANGVPTEYEEVKFNEKSVNTMKKGDQLEVATADGKKQGLLKYNGDGTYVFKFEYAEGNEAIHVEWEPVTADILVSKVWDDEDDKDGMREDAYERRKFPFFRLEYSINGGRTWNPVNNNTIGGTTAQPSTTISPEQVPSGKDEESGSPTQGTYLDGTYTINKGTTGTYGSDPAATQPAAAQLTQITETCDGLPVFENQKTFKKYVLKDDGYHEVTSVDHPYTWQNLPVYKYDASGDADRMISYRIVEYHVSDADPTKFVDNEAIKDYEPAEYYDAQAFELTSETSKSVEGWQIYEDSSSGKTYVKRGDELYYEVDSIGAISDTPADPQPDEGRLVAQTSIEYRTADKGIAYQMADVRNYHEPKYVYVEVGKEWNDDGIKDVTTGDNVNEYARKNLKFVLKGKTTAGPVDINGDAEGQDLATIIKENETADRTAAEADKKIDGYQIFEKENDSSEKYAWVKGHDDYEDGYYKIVNDAIDYADPAAPHSGLTDLVAIGAFKKDEKNFGMRFEDLPTHDGGKPITYTVTEYFEDTSTTPSTWIEAGDRELAWITTGGELKEVRIIDGNTSKVVGYTSDFINTPTIEDVYETLPLTILKQDAVTENPLETAEFTIYRKSTGSKAFDKNDIYEVEGQTIYYKADDTVEYVLRKKDGQPASDERLYYHTFTKDAETGDYKYTYVTSQPDASELTVKKQMVESNEITTKINGTNTFNILLPGNYEVKETKAPTGYTADPKSYTFNVDRNLKKITLENYDNDHGTKWWKKLWDLLFRYGQPDNGIWEPNENKKGGKLTVNDQPIDANILVRKSWEDNDDQDGVRPEDGHAKMPKVVLQWTTAAHTATGLPVYTDAKGKVKYIHNQADNKYYKVTKEDTLGEYEVSAATPQPDEDDLTAVTDTCQGRKVYKDSDDKLYVYVDEKYHELKKESGDYLVDTPGTIESEPAASQPKESDLRLVMDEGSGWQQTYLYDETSKKYDDEAKAPVNYEGGPVLTHQHDAYTWNDVPAYRDGKPVVYRVSETSPLLDDGTYKLKHSHTSDTKEKVFTLINNSGENVTTHNQTVDVTNRHETRIINIDAYKVWNDDDQSKRSESTLTLWKTVNGARSIVSKTENGHSVDDKGTVPVTDTTDPVKTWSDLPVFERGYPITYTIVEESIDGYRTVYELDYTKEDGTEEGTEVHEKSDTVNAKDVKRTYYQGATDKMIGSETVYTDGDKEYVERDGTYYEVTGDTVADEAAESQPNPNKLDVAKNDDSDIPSGAEKDPGDENTTASFTIENEETIDIEVKKTWIDGANANVKFELWRTTLKVDDLTSSEFVHQTVCYRHNATGNYISVQDYEALPAGEKNAYTAVEGKDWSPFDPADSSKTVDGWTKVKTDAGQDEAHEFLSSLFKNKPAPGDSQTYTFEDLPRQEIETVEGETVYKDKNDESKKYVLKEDPEATGEDVGKEFYFTYTLDDDTGKYTYTKANPQPEKDALQISYLAYMYRIYETPRGLVRFALDQTSDFAVTNYNVHAANGFANVEVVKELKGRAWDVNGKDEFYFEMEAVGAEDKTDTSHRISKDDVPLPSRLVPDRTVYTDGTKRYVIDGDDLYREVDSENKVADKPVNPQPKADGLTPEPDKISASINYPIDTSTSKKVGAIGRAVDFKSIEFSDETVIPRGNTVEFNYKVREVYDMLGTSLDAATDHTGKRNGITYAGKVVGGEFVPEEHNLKIVVKNDPDGKKTTEIYWDGASQTGAVPVYTNSYSSESEAKAWIEKEIASREWQDYDNSAKTGDAFQYEVLAISGSQLNVPNADHSAGDDSYTSKPLISNADDNPQSDIQQESDYEYAFGLTGNKYTGDMLNSSGEGYFIYAIREKEKIVEWKDEEHLFGGLEFENYAVDGLQYDDSTIYAKVKVNDNWDGTLRFEVKYYKDAACREEITDYQVWIEDRFTGGSIDPTAADPQPEDKDLVETTETIGNKTVYKTETGKRYVKVSEGDSGYYHEVIGGTEGKRLLSQDEIEAMGSMSQKEVKANGYRQVYVAHFINKETLDIPVTKEWVGGPAVEDVNLHLKRHLFELKDEEKLDSKIPSTETEPTGDDFVKSAEKRWTDTENPFWQPVGLTHIVERGAFLDANGEPKYDDDEKTISIQTYGDLKADDGSALEKEDYIKGFNKDLPKYVKVNGKIYRAVYRLEEDDTSDAYKRSYKRVEESETPGGDPVVKKDAQIYINSGTLVVTNKVTATNTANIAAVKQLLGRGWMNTDDIKDDFEFEIEALGKGKYNKDTGKFVSVDTSAEAKAAVPMPGHYKNKNDDDDVISIEAYNALTDEQKANYEYVGNNKEAHAKKGETTVDPNGDLERLARFDSIEYKVTDLTYDPSDNHMQGDFFYVIKEKIPNDATIEVTEGDTTTTVKYEDATAAQKAAGGFKKNGITYDGTEHIVHVKVRENRTGKLQTQIAYDENPKYDSNKYKADITTGTQFTPVYTNKYTSEADIEVSGNKYIMGRDWEEGDNFDFVMIPMAGAPFKDAVKGDFPAQDTKNDADREAGLEDGKAIHNKDGEHVMRLVVDPSKDVQTFSFPKIKVKSEDLHKVTDAESQADPEQGELDKRIKDKDGNVLPLGVTYGQFMYAIAETDEFDDLNEGSIEDLIKDPDTEYARVTVYDPGNGVLEYRVDIFEDRYANIPRYKPDPDTGEKTNVPADSVTFVNKLDRDLTAIKAWDGTATEDVTLRLEWAVLDEEGKLHFQPVEGTEWFLNVEGTKIIRKDATGDELKALWEKLPTYANIEDHDDVTGETGDNIELNDKWIYYRVVETPEPQQAAVRYNEVAYEEDDTTSTKIDGKDKYTNEPYHTGPERDPETGEYLKPEDRVHTLHVTNFPKDTPGEVTFGVVKQYIGKTWEDEEFEFVVEPVKSRLGGSELFVPVAQQSMPTAFAGNDRTATAVKDSDYKVSVNEYAANFRALTIKRSDLAYNSKTKKMEGEFVYKITEVLPPNAEKTAESCGKDSEGNTLNYYVANDGKRHNIKYTTEEHYVTIKAVDEGNGAISFDVSYDGRNSGEYVPVYTNYALMPTPITGTKTWIGGEESEHVNGKVTLNDDNTQIVQTDDAPDDYLKLKLQRKLPGDEGFSDVKKDDAGRDLVFIWAVEKRIEKPVDEYVRTGDPDVVEGTTYYYYDQDTGSYKEVPETEGKHPADEGWYEKRVVIEYDYEYVKQETGDATYTIKAEVEDGDKVTYADPFLKTADADGNEYEYQISEGAVPKKYKESIEGLDVTNTYKVKDSIKVTKTWDDAQDAEGLRPEEVIVHLYKEVIVPATTEGGEATTKTVQVEVDKKTIEPKGEEKDVWSTGVVFEELPLYDSNGNVIKYYVLEEGVAGYTGTYAVDSTDADDYKAADHLEKVELDGQKDKDDPESEEDNPQFIDIKNSLTPATDEVTVEKIWDDNDNAQGKRPSDVEFKLYKYIWDEDDSEYKKEAVTTRPAVQDDVGVVSGVTKVGDDVTVTTLTLDGTADTENTIAYETEAWKGTWKNLPLTENGKTVIYTIEENTEGSAYAAPGTQGKYSNTPCVTGNQFDGYKVKNVYTDELTEAKITKVWKDNNNAWNTRPRKLHVELYRTYEGADGQPVTPERVTTDAEGNSIKEEISADDEDPDANTWVHKYNKLPKYTSLDVDGTTVSREYTYFWKETVPTGYVAKGRNSGDQAVEVVGDGSETAEIKDKTTVTNTYVTGSIVLTKTWDDQSDVDKLRTKATDYLGKLTLYMGDRKITDFSTITRECRDNDDNTFTVTYGNLPVFDKDGTAISYTVEEKVPNGYSIATDPAAVLTKTLDNTQEAPTVFTGLMSLTNEHQPELIDIEITKNWIDQAGFEHIDAENYKNELKLLADGEEVTDTYADKLTITPSSDGTTEDVFGIKWSELPKYKVNPLTGKLVEIVYKVTERQVDGYAEATYDNTGAYDKSKKTDTSAAYNGGEINNTQVISIDVKKTWDDNNNHDNKRGDIKVVLFRNGVKYAEKTLKETDDNISINGNVWTWTGVWTGLEYADPKGTTYNYTASEEAPQPWYEAFVDGQKLIQILLDKWNDDNNTLIFEVTNKHDDETVGFTVDKIWDDKSDVDGLRPSKIYFRLYQTVDGTTTLVEDLPEGASVKTVTNTAGEVDGDADYDNGYVEIDAKKSDKTQGTLNRVFFEDLPKYAEGGKLITYTVEEDGDISTEAIEPVRAYTTERSGDQSAGYTFKNTHSPVSVTVNPKAKKALDGRSFKSGDEFTFKLTVDSPTNAPTPTPDLIKINPTSGTVKEFNIGEITFTGADMIDKLNAGDTKKFTYKLTEVDAGKTIDDIIYSTQELTLEITVSRKADGGLEVTDSNIKWTGGDGDNHDTITNKFITDTDLIIRKIWVDDDADDTSIGSRPESITIVITAEASVETASLVDAGFQLDSEQSTDVRKVYTKEINISESESGTLFNDSVWQKKIEGLPKLDAAGESITYTVDENDVPNYTKTDPVQKDEGRWIITNTYKRVSITGTKEWRDDGKTHDNTTEVELAVYRQAYDTDGSAVGDPEEVSGSHIHWEGDTYTITGVPAKDEDGNSYTYWTVEEKVDGYDNPVYDNSASTGTTAEQKAETKAYNGGKIINSALTSITLTKKWDDAKYFEGEAAASGVTNEYKRPGVTFTVTATATTTEEIKALTKSETSGGPGFTWDNSDKTKYTKEVTLTGETEKDITEWTKKIDNLPMYDQEGKKIKYTSQENTADGADLVPAEGFDKTEDKTDDLEASNKPKEQEEVDSIDLTIKKEDGATENHSGLNGAEFTVYQSNGRTKATTGNDGMVERNTVITSGEGTDAGKTTVTFLKPGTYVIKETGAPKGYALSEKTFTVQVDKKLESIKLSSESDPDESFWTWLYKLIFNGDKPESMSGDDTHGYTLKVDDDPLRAEVLVDKVWDDKNDQDGLRKKAKDENALPKVKLQYKSGEQWLDADETILGTQEGTKTVPDKDGKISGGRTYTWKDIPAYLDGEKIEYRVIEIDKIEGYEAPTYDKQTFTLSNDAGTEAENVEVSVTNKYEPETASVQVSKKWNDINNLDEMRVGELSFKLTSNNGYEKTLDLDILTDVDDGEEAIETPDDAKWTKLPVYKNGEKIMYTLTETTKIKGYTAEYTGTDAEAKNVEFTLSEREDGDTEDKIYTVTVTNVHVPDARRIWVKKEWNDNNDQDGKRGPVTVELVEADDSAGTWDGNDKDGNKVEPLTLDASGNYRGSFDNLKAVDGAGKKITYAVEEKSAPSGYDTDDATYSGSGTHADPFVITNSRDADTVTVTATKEWAGDDEFSGETRKDITLHLIGRKGDGMAWDGGSKTIAVGADPAKAEWTGLPRKIDGTELTWEVYEDTVPGYAMSLSGSGTPDDEGNVEFTVTNTYVGAASEITATKVWYDDNNRDGIRSDVYFQLYRSVGYDGDEEAVGDPVNVEVNTTAADGEDAGSATWNDLPELITETESSTETKTIYVKVEEIAEGDNPSEKGWFVSDGADGYVLTEDPEPEEGTEYFEKKDEDVTTETTTERAVIYTVKEVDKDGNVTAPEGYESVVTQTSAGEFVISNIHSPKTTDLSVQKIWIDDDDIEGFRPDHIKFRIKHGEKTVREVAITAEDEGAGWNSGVYTFTGLTMNEDGEPIDYKVVELDSDGETELDGSDGHDATSYGYTVSVSGEGTAENPVVVTNTHAVGGKGTLTVTKAWEGDEKHKKETRGDVKLHLIKVVDGARKDAGQDKTIEFDPSEPDKAMTAKWTDLPTSEDGKPVVYTVEEYDVPQGYKASVSDTSVSGEDMTLTVTNTYSETPAFGEDVIYVDPLNPKGKMVLKSNTYDTHSEAEGAANSQSGAPTVGEHKNYKFTGWAVNYDENGNFVLVATYSEIPQTTKPTTSYIDPQSGKPLLISEETDDPSSVKVPKDPKHDNLVFVGWVKTKDVAGNTIFVAKYECKCEGGNGQQCDDTSVGGNGKGAGGSSKNAGVNTGDDNLLYFWITLFLLAAASLAFTTMRRRREYHRAYDNSGSR